MTSGQNPTRESILGGPAVILVQPQLGENIGACARAMLNCGLTDLRLVLAARLGIERDGDRGRGWSANDRRMRVAYHWLGGVQDELLAAMAERDD